MGGLTHQPHRLPLKFLGIPTSSSCWHGHLRFHHSPPYGGVCKIRGGSTARNLGIVSTAYRGPVVLRINNSIVEKEMFWWNRIQFPVVAPIGLAIHIGIM